MNQPSPYGPQPNYPPTLPQPYQTPPQASGPKRHYSLIPIILAALFFFAFLGSSGFAFWAYGQMQDYKNNVDEKVDARVDAAVEQAKQAKEEEFLERSKSPFKKYVGPSTFGSIEITYPKTWSAAVTTTPSSSPPVEGYFHPNYVPGKDSGTAFALHLEVIGQPYDQVMAGFENTASTGDLRISPFKAKRVPSVLGARLDGTLSQDINGIKGSAVVFPLRDKTIKISVESQSFMNDFNKIILPNLLFAP